MTFSSRSPAGVGAGVSSADAVAQAALARYPQTVQQELLAVVRLFRVLEGGGAL